MNISKRLYTYPILCEEKDDYQATAFNVEMEYKTNDINTLLLMFNIVMNNVEINELLGLRKVEFVIHLECSTTAYRTTIHSAFNKFDFEIPLERINGKLEVVAFIVAKEPIYKFSSTDWNQDYDGITFELKKGSILGYQNLSFLDITKDYEELANTSSIFLVHRRLSEDSKPMEIDLDSGKIKIGLSSDEFNVYSRFCDKTKFQPILNTMIILPALVFTFEELKQVDGLEMYRNKNWFISLKRAYEKRGLDFVHEVMNEDKSSITLAQEVMSLPLKEALSKLSELYEEYEEEL